MRLALLVAAAMILSACGSSRTAGSSSGVELVAISYAGSSQIPHRKFLADPFEATHPGVKIRLVPSESEDVVAQIKAAQGASPYDVIPMGEPRQITAIQEGWIEQTPRDQLPNLWDVYPQFVKACKDYGVPETFSLIGLAYNPDLVPEPKAWGDLWKTEYRGKLGLTTPASVLGFGFLVMVARTFGGNESNMNPAWSKLRELEPFVVAPNPTALAQLFERHEVAIAPLWNNDAAILASKGLKVKFAQPAPGAVVVVSCLDVIKSSANLGLARQYINDVVSAEYQSRAVQAPYFFGPTNKNVKMPANSGQYLPATPEDISRFTLLDWDAAALARPGAIERFNREFAR